MNCEVWSVYCTSVFSRGRGEEREEEWERKKNGKEEEKRKRERGEKRNKKERGRCEMEGSRVEREGRKGDRLDEAERGDNASVSP